MIPVNLLTGFLGSGKTTLLSRLLRHRDFAHTAVVMNELGEVGLDHELIANSDEQFIELTTGCLCCKVQSDLVATLEDMLSRRDAGTVMRFDRIVIETTGLADPAPIFHALMTTPSLIECVELASIVTTVDCMTGMRTLKAETVSRKQIAVADRLILTKTDMAGGVPSDLTNRLDGLNASAARHVAIAGEVDPALLFAQSGFEQPAAPHPNPLPVDDGESGRGDHLDGIAAHVVVRDAPMAAITLTLFLEALAEHCGSELLRMKGLVAIAEAPDTPAVVHGVQHVFHPLTWLENWPSADRRTRLVFITRSIPKSWIEALLAAIEAEVAETSPMR